MTILPAYLITSTQLRVTLLIFLPWVYFINYLPQQMSIWQPYFDIQKHYRAFSYHTNKTDAYHQYKLCHSM